MDRLIKKPNNSFLLGLLLGGLLLVTLIFPLIQMLALFFTVDLWVMDADCDYCTLTGLKIFYAILLVLWTLFCFYRATRVHVYQPIFLATFMLVGYLLTNTLIALIFEKEALRSNDAFKYIFLYSIGPYSCLTPVFYGLVFHLIGLKRKTAYNRN